jgi:hypothetical protein
MTEYEGVAFQSPASADLLGQARRKADTQAYNKFRPSRFVKTDGKWYFATREGTMEGPFELRREAEHKLDSYIKIMLSGFVSRDRTLSVHPLHEPALLESTPLT